jgi:hypothetical protein
MLTGISNIANPRKLRTIVKQLRLKPRIVFAVPRVLSRMLLVPNPVLDVPRGKGCADSVPPAGVRFELPEGTGRLLNRYIAAISLSGVALVLGCEMLLVW